MKLVSALFLGLTLTVLVSCGGGDAIVKTWKLDDMNFEELLKEMPKETQEMMMKNFDENMAKTKGKIILTFEKDGKFKMTDGSNPAQTGTWKMAADKKSFTADMKGEKQEFTIHELTDDKLSIEPKGEKMKLIFVPKN